MTRKTKKGIVGKSMPTSEHTENVGVGISFTQEHVSDGDEIREAVKRKNRQQEVK